MNYTVNFNRPRFNHFPTLNQKQSGKMIYPCSSGNGVFRNRNPYQVWIIYLMATHWCTKYTYIRRFGLSLYCFLINVYLQRSSMNVTKVDFDRAVSEVVEELKGINSLYAGQYDLLHSLMKNENIFYTSSTNSGKTLPGVIYPSVLKKLNSLGYNFPSRPKVLFLTALNSIKLSILSNVKGLGLAVNLLLVTI